MSLLMRRASALKPNKIKQVMKNSMLRELKRTKLRQLKTQMRRYDLICLCLGTLCMALGPIEQEIFFKGEGGAQFTITQASNGLRFIMTALSVALGKFLIAN